MTFKKANKFGGDYAARLRKKGQSCDPWNGLHAPDSGAQRMDGYHMSLASSAALVPHTECGWRLSAADTEKEASHAIVFDIDRPFQLVSSRWTSSQISHVKCSLVRYEDGKITTTTRCEISQLPDGLRDMLEAVFGVYFTEYDLVPVYPSLKALTSGHLKNLLQNFYQGGSPPTSFLRPAYRLDGTLITSRVHNWLRFNIHNSPTPIYGQEVDPDGPPSWNPFRWIKGTPLLGSEMKRSWRLAYSLSEVETGEFALAGDIASQDDVISFLYDFGLSASYLAEGSTRWKRRAFRDPPFSSDMLTETVFRLSDPISRSGNRSVMSFEQEIGGTSQLWGGGFRWSPRHQVASCLFLVGLFSKILSRMPLPSQHRPERKPHVTLGQSILDRLFTVLWRSDPRLLYDEVSDSEVVDWALEKGMARPGLVLSGHYPNGKERKVVVQQPLSSLRSSKDDLHIHGHGYGFSSTRVVLKARDVGAANQLRLDPIYVQSGAGKGVFLFDDCSFRFDDELADDHSTGKPSPHQGSGSLQIDPTGCVPPKSDK